MCSIWEKRRFEHPLTKKQLAPNSKEYLNLYNKCKNLIKYREEHDIIQLDNFDKPVIKINEELLYIDSDRKRHIVSIPQQIDDYILNKRVGSGGFGTIYECYDIKDPEKKLVIKLEHRLSGPLFVESKIFRDRRFYKNALPNIERIGVFQDLRYVVMEHLNEYKFQISDIKRLLEILQIFSDNGRIHADIKMQNIMKRDDGTIVFIDLGLSTKIKTQIKVEKVNIQGTKRLMSINAHRGYSTFKNDLESLVYMILDQIGISLPWGTRNFSDKEFVKLKSEFLKDLANNYKTHFKDNIRIGELVAYTQKLQFDEKPKYDDLIKIFSR